MNKPLRFDWVARPRTFFVAWGLPTVVLLVGIFLDPTVRTFLWTAGLAWMGLECLANASRCGRTHCYFTGPFLLLTAVASLLHEFEIVWLGPDGWIWLGITVAVGGALLWWVPEHVLGRFTSTRC